jgi:hypothetical protein
VNIRRLKLPTNLENQTIKMKHREPEYNIYSAKDGWKNLVSRGEWASWVKAGKRGSINQIVGWFGTSGNLSWILVSTGPSNRWHCAAGEWESLVLDHVEIDLVNPSYCCGSIKEIEAMHGQAVSNARKWLRNYVERPIHYSENMLTRADPLHLAKSPDFQVNYYEELELSTKELEDLFRHDEDFRRRRSLPPSGPDE